MNKNVFEYLSGKTHEVTDYIKAKAQAAGEYLDAHASDIQQGIIKGTSTVLTVAMLASGLAACDNISLPGSTPKLDTYISLPVRPVEEIEETGIKAEDVLALYDSMAEKCVKAHYATTNWKDKLGDKFEQLDGEFISLTPKTRAIGPDAEAYTLPFYLPTNMFSLGNFWIVEPSSPYYKEDKFIDGEYIYELNFNSKANLLDSSDSLNFKWGIPKNSFDAVLSALNTPSRVLNQDELQDSIPNSYIANIDDANLWGTSAYDSITIDRNTIQNATPEQLWALYNMFNSMIELNFNGKVLNSSNDHTIVD